MTRFLPILFLAALPATSLSAETYSVDVWSDNWFEMRINGETVMVDSVPITTERSFNAESFTFEADAPFTIGLIGMDFRENDTGLEYIGTNRQQMGDGGMIAQIYDAAGDLAASTDGEWNCIVTHTAPMDASCESEANPVAGVGACAFEISAEPDGWDEAGYDDSEWPNADVYTAAQVDPKFGYNDVDWDDSAEFIWGPDLERSNTVLCRLSVE